MDVCSSFILGPFPLLAGVVVDKQTRKVILEILKDEKIDSKYLAVLFNDIPMQLLWSEYTHSSREEWVMMNDVNHLVPRVP